MASRPNDQSPSYDIESSNHQNQSPNHPITQSNHPITQSPNRVLLWLPVILYMAGIFVASSIPDPPVPQAVPDISLHEAAYFGLTLLAIRALSRASWRGVTVATLAAAWLIAVGYGVTDEWHQSYVATRHAELRDLIADAIGAFVATIVVGAWGIIRRL